MFLKAHWRSIVAADFFTAEVWSLRGLVTYYVLFVIELAKRIVHIAGITTQPNEAHGGRLWATANLVHGAVFQFSLPVEEASL